MENTDKQPVEPSATSAPGNQSAARGCRQACLVILVIVLAPYWLNALITLGGSFFNRTKWHAYGSPNYTLTAGEIAFSPLGGENRIVVQSGRVISGTSPYFEHCQDYPRNFEVFQELTVDRLFDNAYPCALLFPFLTCSFEYDQHLGYPTKVNIDCPIPDACLTHITVTDLQIAPP